jgi:hypothetical protein
MRRALTVDLNSNINTEFENHAWKKLFGPDYFKMILKHVYLHHVFCY